MMRNGAACCRWLIALSSLVLLPCSVSSFELYKSDELSITGELEFRAGLQRGWEINHGTGAFDALGETERSALWLSVRPASAFTWERDDSTFYGAFQFVAATTTLDGELSGQIARSGDRAVDTDALHLGWRNGWLDLSVGAQEYTIGDGFAVGDGNFNQGPTDGQYWIGSYTSWRNTAIARFNTNPLKGEIFWLRTDDDLGDNRVVGFNIENSAHTDRGTLGFMYLTIIDDHPTGFQQLKGMHVWGVRGANVKVPGIDALTMFGEFVNEGGEYDRNNVDNDAQAWYIEAQYQFNDLPLTPLLAYRYSRFSGNELGTADNEEYRGLFFTIFKRGWDTWYQGEIAGEYHLFNQNQITQMTKLSFFPNASTAIRFAYFDHALEEPQYFGRPVISTDWSKELNFFIEYYPSDKLYAAFTLAWASPDEGAVSALGDDENMSAAGLFLLYTFK